MSKEITTPVPLDRAIADAIAKLQAMPMEEFRASIEAHKDGEVSQLLQNAFRDHEAEDLERCQAEAAALREVLQAIVKKHPDDCEHIHDAWQVLDGTTAGAHLLAERERGRKRIAALREALNEAADSLGCAKDDLVFWRDEGCGRNKNDFEKARFGLNEIYAALKADAESEAQGGAE